MDLAAEWIARGDVDGCLVVASEENDWLSAEALLHYSRDYVPSEGAAAIYIEPSETGVKLLRLPDPVPFSALPRDKAALKVRDELQASDDSSTLLVDGRVGIAKIDVPETRAWQDWSGPRISPRSVLGESMGASSALQMVVAVESIRSGKYERSAVTAVGGNQQAAGVLLGS
jgi:hypothetical protein